MAHPSIDDDEEEGSMTSSAEFDEIYELTKIRVNVHCDGDVRASGMVLKPEVPFLEFKQRVVARFESSVQSIMLKFRDEDGGKVSLRDESDYDLAIETAACWDFLVSICATACLFAAFISRAQSFFGYFLPPPSFCRSSGLCGVTGYHLCPQSYTDTMQPFDLKFDIVF